MKSIPTDERPLDHTPITTADLPPTPIRDHSIPATAWTDAPASLLELGAGLDGTPVARFLRRIGPWLLWRAGPPANDDAYVWAALADDLSQQCTLHIHPDGSASGVGPRGQHHERFRTWKEDLRDFVP